MEKELMIIRDNAERIKRKYQLDLYQVNTELEESRKKLKKLEESNKELNVKAEQIPGLEVTINDLESIIKKTNHEL